MNPHEKTVRVALARNPYDILIGENTLAAVAEYLERWCGECRHVALITDENVEPLYAIPVADALVEAGIETDVCVVPAGEESKCVELADTLWQQLIESGADRQTVVVAVGGGVVGDLAGFVAATLNRGVRFVQIPTTLLAQVDSSVGGKVGINIPQGKNLVGAFLQPEGVLVDMHTLTTLDARQYSAGLAEVVKYGVILDADFFAFLEQHAEAVNARDPAVLAHVIARCCELKAMIVREDERETTGRRALLNYGHTYAHAIEKLSGYGHFLHGEAVGIGMIAAARLARILAEHALLQHTEELPGLRDLEARQIALWQRLGIPTDFPKLDPNAVLAAMLHDKKTVAGEYRFILPTQLGECVLRSVSDRDAILEAAGLG